MRRLFAVISSLMILAGCTSAATVVPTATNTPRPTVTPIRKANVPEVATQLAIAAETQAFLPTATAARITPPTKLSNAKPIPTTDAYRNYSSANCCCNSANRCPSFAENYPITNAGKSSD